MKKISEADLLRLGFKRVDVPAEESGDEDYFYFVYETPKNGESLLITADEDPENDSYHVEFSELWEIINIKNLDDLEKLVGVVKRNLNED